MAEQRSRRGMPGYRKQRMHERLKGKLFFAVNAAKAHADGNAEDRHVDRAFADLAEQLTVMVESKAGARVSA